MKVELILVVHGFEEKKLKLRVSPFVPWIISVSFSEVMSEPEICMLAIQFKEPVNNKIVYIYCPTKYEQEKIVK